jgi:hypothetical protein
MKSTLRALGLAAALGSTVLVSGCASTSGTAAIVDGRRITEEDARLAAEQINQQFKPQTTFTAKAALSSLIFAPALIEAAEAKGQVQSAGSARSKLPDVQDPADSTILLVRASDAAQRLTAEDEQKILARIAKMKVTVNPRYGTFDASQPGVIDSVPSWISKGK